MHSRYPFTLSLVLAILIVYPAMTCPAAGPATSTSSPTLTINQAIGSYRRAAADPIARAKAIDAALALGDAARAKLFAVVDRDAGRLLTQYQSKFGKAALVVGAALRKKHRLEVAKDQKAIRKLALGKPSKGAITSTADPALKRLTETLTPSRQDVIDSSRSLAKLAEDLAQKLADRAKLAANEDLDVEADIQSSEALAILMSLAVDRRHWAVLQANQKILPKLDPEEAVGLRYLNRIRMMLGMNPVSIDTRLGDAARDHSKDMHEKKFFSHTSPVRGKARFTQRAMRFKTTARAENIAQGYRSGKVTIMQWWHSPGHFTNMLNLRHMRVGLGRVVKTWTQMFG
jgi:uncharacterized protein YkwD